MPCWRFQALYKIREPFTIYWSILTIFKHYAPENTLQICNFKPNNFNLNKSMRQSLTMNRLVSNLWHPPPCAEKNQCHFFNCWHGLERSLKGLVVRQIMYNFLSVFHHRHCCEDDLQSQWKKMGILTCCRSETTKILLQKFHIFIRSWGATGTPNFIGIGHECSPHK